MLSFALLTFVSIIVLVFLVSDRRLGAIPIGQSFRYVSFLRACVRSAWLVAWLVGCWLGGWLAAGWLAGWLVGCWVAGYWLAGFDG